ncbi:hypothetical protein EP7_001738 [Isosphaeraceae bacterium EP7]
MIRQRSVCLLAVLGLSFVLTAVGAGFDDPEQPVSPPALVLPATGTQCRVELKPEKDDKGRIIEVSYEGKVSDSKEDGITLAVSSVKRTHTTNVLGGKIPILNRFFRNVGIGRMKPGEEKPVWIPEPAILSVKELDQD